MFGTRGRGARRRPKYWTPDNILEMLRVADNILERLIDGYKLAKEGKMVTIDISEVYKKFNQYDLRSASYRFLRLKPGCGHKAVKSAFRKAIKELRPDLQGKNKEESAFKEKKYSAIKTARDILLKFEVDDNE